MTPRIRVLDDTIQMGRVSITFQRTLRIPDDGTSYPLPPGLGAFPVRRVKDYAKAVPADWRERGGYFIPMYQREALWIAFEGEYWRPNAVKVGVGGINAISGRRWDDRLRSRPQDYLVVPDQPWLDGINAGKNVIRQFVAMPLGQGFTVEGQITGKEEEGGIQLTVVEPRPGKFPNRPPRGFRSGGRLVMACCESVSVSSAMGLAAGGRMEQKIYPDAYGIDTWDANRAKSVYLHIVNSETFRSITGENPPPSPISARTYTEYGYPWFSLYDEHKKDLPAPGVLNGVKSIREMEEAADRGTASAVESVTVQESQILGILAGKP